MINTLYKHRYLIIAAVIALITILLRIYRFDHLWGLLVDDSRDIMIAQEAIIRRELPPFNSFSSAGPFMFGPLFYWFIMASYIVLPGLINAPWILNDALGIVTTGVLAYCGYLLGGKRLAAVTGLLAATAPQFVFRATALTQHTHVGYNTIFLIASSLLFLKTKKIHFAFLMGLFTGSAIMMHYQALNLLIFIGIIALAKEMAVKKKLLAGLLFTAGALLPAIPLIVWDSGQGFANTRNLLDYFLIAQYRIYVPNSWRLYVFTDLPKYWSVVVGGQSLVAVITMGIIGVSGALSLWRKKITFPVGLLGSITFLFIILLRYYKGERSEGYLMYLSPLVLLTSAWAINRLIWHESITKIRHPLYARVIRGSAITFLLIVTITNIVRIEKHINHADNSLKEVNRVANLLKSKYPNQKFSLYDYKQRTNNTSYPLSAILAWQQITAPGGIPIGVSCGGCGPKEGFIGNHYYSDLYDLRVDRTLLTNGEWTRINREDIYDEHVTKWLRNEKLPATFSLSSYVLEKLRLKK